MNRSIPLIVGVLFLSTAFSAMAADRGITNTSSSPHVKLRSVDLDDVRWTSGFWGDRYALVRDVTTARVEEAMRQPENGAQLANFEIAAGLADGEHGGTPWSDGDCYKLLETYAHLYAINKDPAIDKKMDYWIEVIGKAQDEDGYISTNIGHDKSRRMQMPYQHQLYNMGHLLTAACIHHRATGKKRFLGVARKLGDYLYREFKPNPPRLVHFPWNPSVYMGLVELYRTTGSREYLEVAEIMINNRGSSPGGGDHRNGGTDQTQDRVPLREETKAVGHAVCAMYLYCGAADLYAETGEKALLDALERIWLNVTTRKMDITGSVGFGRLKSERGDPCHEAFGAEHQLPNQYNETCATLAYAMWNWRFLAITGEAKYADTVETVMYNGGLSPLSIDGKTFFYTNPLLWKPSDVKKGNGITFPAQRWWTASGYCCPPQITRTIAKLHNWCYGIDDGGLYVHLYGSNQVDTKLADGSVLKLTQKTNYPWEGKITFAIEQCTETPFALNVRIPGWADEAELTLNGEPLTVAAKPGTYARVQRGWQAGDQLVLDLPLRIRLMESHPNVEANRNKVAVTRGPIVYCFEAPLAKNGEEIWKRGVFLPENITMTEEFRKDLLGGVVVLNGKALTTEGRKRFVRRIGQMRPPEQAEWGEGVLYRKMVPRDLQYQAQSGTLDVTLIPYFAWANRGPSYMEVWIPLAR